MDVYNSKFESNFRKINQNCGNLPENFFVDKLQAYFCGNFHRLSAFMEIKWSRITLFLGHFGPPKIYL